MPNLLSGLVCSLPSILAATLSYSFTNTGEIFSARCDMPTVPTTRNAITKLLQNEGEMCAADIAERLGFTRKSVDGAIHVMRKRDMLHIVDWKRNFSTGGCFGAIYAQGKGFNLPKPKINARKESQQRYRDKMREVIRLKTKARRGSERNIWMEMLGK